MDPQVGAVACEAGDLFLLCTDGLVEALYDHHLVELMRAPASGGSEAGAARRLVEASLAQGARDNVTALVVEVV